MPSALLIERIHGIAGNEGFASVAMAETYIQTADKLVDSGWSLDEVAEMLGKIYRVHRDHTEEVRWATES